MSSQQHGLWSAYRIPLLLSVGSIVGLVSALIGDGIFDLLSWLALGSLVLIIVATTRKR